MSYRKRDVAYVTCISEVMSLGCIVSNVCLGHSQGPENAVSPFLIGDAGYQKEVCVGREQMLLGDRGSNYKPN